MEVSVCTSYGNPVTIEIDYRILKTGFIIFDGTVREIREIHETRRGIQIELY